MIKIDNPFWQAELSAEYGGNLYRLIHKPSGLSILRTPEKPEQLKATPELYGVPLILPPNRIDGGIFNFDGRKYQLPLNEPARGNHLHGFFRASPWQVIKADDFLIELSNQYTASEGFPHDFSVFMRYEFQKDAVVQTFQCTNNSLMRMPFGVGFHTAFNLPKGASAAATSENWCWELLEPRFLPSGNKLKWDGTAKVMTEDRKIRCHCPVKDELINGKLFRGLIISYPGTEYNLYYEIDKQFRFWFLWNYCSWREYLCAEPMTWAVNAPNLSFPPEFIGMQSIAPGKTWQAASLFRLSKA